MSGGEDKTPKMDLTYHMGSSDAPGNIITPIQLRGDNYDEWARAVKTSLKAKRKYGFVDGSITKPTDEVKLEDWEVVHSMLVSWITNTLEPSVRSTIGEYDDAYLLWTNLKNRFCVVSGTRICQLKLSLGLCKQEKGESVAAYFGRLTKIWDELHTYVNIPSCSCGKCTCNIVSKIEKMQHDDYVHNFLIGLDDKFASIRSQLLAQEPLPGVDKSYQQVIQAERLSSTEAPTSSRDGAMAFKIQSDPKIKMVNSDHSDRYCTHCNREGHAEASCFQLHGYPEWWGDRPRGGRGVAARGGSSTGRGGGRIGGRGRGQNFTARANKTGGWTASSAPTQGAAAAVATPADGAALSGVSAAQIQQLLDHLNNLKPKLHGPSDEEGDWSG